jgi:hypothetical protein
MTRFTVVWSDEAVQELATAWLTALDRDSVTRAAADIETKLRTDPERNGLPLSEGLHKIVCPALAALFSISEPDRGVRVEKVKLLAPGS